MRTYALLASTVLSAVSAAVAQQLDYPAELVSGRVSLEGISGRLIVADTALFFTQRNGEPILALPFGTIADAYTSPDPSGRRGRTAADRYLVLPLSESGRAQPLIFSIPAPGADELAAGILGGLDARRTALYSAKPPARTAPAAPQASNEPVRSAIAGKSRTSPAPSQPSRIAENPHQADAAPVGGPVPRSGVPLEVQEGEPGYKDGGTGVLLSLLITGGGQFYAGESGTGAVLLLGSIGALVVGAAASDPYEPNYTPLYVGAGVSVFFWLYSVFDAAPAATRHNRKLAEKRARLAVAPVIRPTDQSINVGIRLKAPW